MIAAKGGLKVAPWDGYLKYYNLGEKVGRRVGGGGQMGVGAWGGGVGGCPQGAW